MDLNAVIDAVLADSEAGKLDPSAYFNTLITEAPDVFAFFFDDDTRLLMESEHDFMLFVAMILVESVKRAGKSPADVDLDELAKAADHNWGMLEFTSIENITTTLEGYEAIPLYEFLEDACSPADDHELLSEVAVELVFVKCKTFVDLAYRTTWAD